MSDQSDHEAKAFLRYLLACATHSEFDLKAHVPRIERILGYKKKENKDQVVLFERTKSPS